MVADKKRILDKVCSVCGARERVGIETVTNVAPRREEMFPVLLCSRHKTMLAKGELDIQMDKNGDLVFITKRKKH